MTTETTELTPENHALWSFYGSTRVIDRVRVLKVEDDIVTYSNGSQDHGKKSGTRSWFMLTFAPVLPEEV